MLRDVEIHSKSVIHYMEDLQLQPTELLEFCLASKPNHDLSHLACVGIHNYQVGVFMERQMLGKVMQDAPFYSFV